MSVSVKSVNVLNQPKVTDNAPHVYEETCNIDVEVVKADVSIILSFQLIKGFMVDGASVPWVFSWFLPKWDKDNFLYNAGSSIHDGLYIHKGFKIFSREECDDILRGIWRLSGISRFKAGVADKCIEWFAGGDGHWGNDSYNVGRFFNMDF